MSESKDPEYVDSYEDVSVFVLDDERERNLLDKQTECTFMWTTDSGAPVGVIMNYLVHEGSFWLTCTRRRKRVAAVEARPRVAMAVTSRGTDIGISQAVTYQGTAVVHDDDEVKAG
jgi:general stress protein 26